ncbi:uncharacterized protein LOC130904364 [Corythoichthys intestinalis]|uniref:uncharacterized protein LOC130904364 n=1 Tax=Corythoichthys intestinalis TaxID=161448 RepID=UPI0025A643B2|nr:uncharacterized protein LOC130904364 [Corythoichthys intestinalis]
MALGIFVLLVFWAVLHDAESECPVGHNPLTMTVSPSEVHYGENVTVSCASSVEDHDGMYLLDANGNTLKEDKQKSSSTLIFQVSDWDMRIHCKIKLKQHDASYECNRTLELTVFRYAKKVRLHQSPFKNGQKTIQCDIFDVAPAKEVIVTWSVDDLFFKSGHVTDDQTKTPMNLSNSITVGEELTGCNITCSYRLKFHSIFPTYDNLTVAGPSFTDLKHPDSHFLLSCDIRSQVARPLGWNQSVAEINASYICVAHQKSSEKIFVMMLFTIEATPTQVARLPVCPLAHSYPKILDKSLDPSSKRCNRNISHLDAYWKDGSNFLITAISEPLEKWSTKYQCHTLVSDLQTCFVLPPISFFRFPDKVKAYVDPDSGPMVAGNIYRLNCDIINVIAPENLTVTWLRGDTIVNKTVVVDTTMSPQNISCPLDIWVSSEENGQIYTCQVEIGIKVLTLQSESSSLNITVEPVRDLKQQDSHFGVFCDMNTELLIYFLMDSEDNSERYLCEIISYSSDENLLFLLNNMGATSERVAQLPVCPVAHPYSEISDEPLDPASKSCERNISRLWQHTSASLKQLVIVSNEPREKWSSTKHQCYSDLNNLQECYVLPPIVFFKEPDEVWAYEDPDSSPMLAGNTYRLNCDIINVIPQINLTVKWLRGDVIINNTVIVDTTISPQNLSFPLTIRVDREENGQIYTCQAEMGDATFFVNTVRRSDLNITVDYEPSFSCASKVTRLVDTELKHPYVVEGKPPPVTTWFKDGIEVTAPHFLTRNSTGEYMIRATNRHGTATHMLYLDVHYAPNVLEDKSSFEFSPGDNLTIKCSCDGNPAPNVSWEHVHATNVRLTGGRQELLKIIEAASTNVGVYNCTATNMLGSVSKSITLIMKGESSADHKSSTVPVAVISACVFLLVMVLVLIFICLFRKTHGQYSFKGKTNNIPLAASASVREQSCNFDDAHT